MNLLKQIKEWVKAVIIAAFVIAVFKAFFFDVLTIPSGSMSNSLLSGDYIVVNKLAYGPRIPNTLLAIPFMHSTIPFSENSKSYLDWIQLPYYRIGNISKVKRNDILVFNYPMEDAPVDQRTYYVKRCVGIPGDNLSVVNGEVSIQNSIVDTSSNLKFNYKVITNGDSLHTKKLQNMGIEEGGRLDGKNKYWFCMTNKQKDNLQTQPTVKHIRRLTDKKGDFNSIAFPGKESLHWNIDYWGPCRVPKAGDSIQLSMDSLKIYERVIGIYEDNKIEVVGDSVFINGKYQTHYTFQLNYFFMMGDNRHNSVDSRFWGFLPEDHVVGKTEMTLMSINKNEESSFFRNDRWFKAID